MKNNTTFERSSSQLITVGLDVGYGITKAVTSDGTVIRFPSVCGHAREIKFRSDELAAKYPGDQIDDVNGSWFIGDLALSQLSVGGLLRLRGRTANETAVGNVFRLRMVLAALGKLLPNRRNGDSMQFRIATGLPVDHMREADKLKEALIGQHRVFTDQTDFVADIVDVMVMPQPYGTIYANMLSKRGEIDPRHTAMRTGTTDAGMYTIDFAVDDNGEYIDVESGSIEFGVSRAHDAISEVYERDHGQKPKYKTVEQILLKGCTKVAGEVVDYSAEVETALEPMRSAVMSKAVELWQAAKEIDVIYVSGGGAPLIINTLKDGGYKQAQLVDDPQIANAQGYLNYALFAQQQ